MKMLINLIKEAVLFLTDLFGKEKRRPKEDDGHQNVVITIVHGDYYATTDHNSFSGTGAPCEDLWNRNTRSRKNKAE